MREHFVKGVRSRSAATSRRPLAGSVRAAIAIASATLLAVILATTQFAGVARAEDTAAIAARISDGAFAMLNGLHGHDGAASNAAMGAVAIFAGDAQALSRTLAAGDRDGAPNALATLESDRGAVDSAVSSNPALLNAADWNRIKAEMTTLAKQIGPARVAPRVSAAASTAAVSATGAAAPARTGTAAPGTAVAPSGAPPRVVVESRTAEGSEIHLKGFIEGSDLKRGGIYAGAREVRAFQISPVAGEQRINFDIGFESPAPGATLRIYDAQGRLAQAPVVDATVMAAGAPDTAGGLTAAGATGPSDAPEIPQLPRAAAVPATEAPSVEGGVEVFRNRGDGGGSDAGGVNTAEITSHGKPRKSPSKRHTMSSHLGNVQITITAENLIDPVSSIYQVAGQIQGHGLSRAGIYDDRRLVSPIAVRFGSDVTEFNQQFRSDGGAITIRAYGVGDQYVESSVDLSNAAIASAGGAAATSIGPGAVLGGPIAGDSGILVQIQAVGPITRNLYVVSGVISGAHLAGAGLYQNGMLVQRIAVNGGIGSMLGALIPGASQNVNFNVRFNPQAGPATIRAFDSSGGYNEQPVVIAGMNPYGASPYGYNPYGNPYNPYGNPYGAYGSSGYPYRTNPYAGGTLGAPPINPYVAPTNPFGSPPPTSSW